MSNTNASSALWLAEGKLIWGRRPFDILPPSSRRSLTVAVMPVPSLSKTPVTHFIPLCKAFSPFLTLFLKDISLSLFCTHSLSSLALIPVHSSVLSEVNWFGNDSIHSGR